MSEVAAFEEQHVAIRLFQRAAQRFRPPLGWQVFVVTLLLAVLPPLAIREARWIDLRRIQVVLEWVPVISLISGWWLVNLLRGWRARRLPETMHHSSQGASESRLRPPGLLGKTLVVLGCFAGALLWTTLGVVTVSQVIVHWIPGPIDLWRAVAAGDPLSLATGARADLSALVWRYSDWLQGVQAGGAYQDNYVFLSFFGVILWLLGGACALLVHSTRNGLIVGAPVLWVLATLLFYGRQGRQLILVGMVTTLLLHVLLDQRRLEGIWTGRNTDFSPMLITDRLLSVFAVAVPMVLLAGFMPNVVIRPVAYKVYQTMTPVYDSVDSVTERMFPDLKGGRRGMGRLSSGLPNRFLLEGGSELGQFEVMRVSTNYPFGPVTELGQMPPRLYMRRGTYSDYNGRGWSNTDQERDASFEANRAWRAEEDWPGRVALVQRVRLTAPAAVLPAAGEPSEFRMEYELERRSPDDLVSVWSGAGPVDRFDVVSYVPAMSADRLRALPAWDGAPMPLAPELGIHLDVSDSVTARTRRLAEQLAAGKTGPFEIAEAIEAYLRTITYNLEVPPPPPETDVADFFLFDLQEGYCDYYTTAFAVLARLNRLPTRFATGYIGGYWDLETGEWTITEAEAHSWPEVYLPEVGWVPFEPTAGRPSLQRENVLQPVSNRVRDTQPAADEEEATAQEWNWSWQALFWLLPLAALLFAAWTWLERRPQDPWPGLLRWGRRIGRPHLLTETELEYGRGLSTHLRDYESEPERRRRLTRNVLGLTDAISQERYGNLPTRAGALARAIELWRAVRRDIRRLPW